MEKTRFNLQAPPVYDRKITNLFFSHNSCFHNCFFPQFCRWLYVHRFAIWMHFKGEYWNYRKYVSKDLVYAPKSSIGIHNIMWCSQFECIFKGEYWIIENMCLKIWYMPLKPAIDIHNNCTTKTHCCTYIHMRDVSFCQATNWVDTTYLHLHTYFHNPKKKTGLNCGSMTCPTGGAPNINMENIIMEEPVNLP